MPELEFCSAILHIEPKFEAVFIDLFIFFPCSTFWALLVIRKRTALRSMGTVDMLVEVSMPLVFFVLIRKLESGVSISSAFLFFFFPFFNFFSFFFFFFQPRLLELWFSFAVGGVGIMYQICFSCCLVDNNLF